ncbi:hypothetical protein SAMN04488032_10427 [Pacificibacter marinus]|uniref:Excalibur calcium-binding domain-containing protein n=2 Tax=Pacificibacter marinus TaxID=658057 RepID=A0A1Y5SM28_9RHOB|nr:hypothetical protein SAMN04488032_10427 [Pacificibacter marinus]SLN42732.1 hypothetical protein PAM7971_02050 [Pacificibacter marinus]
MRRAAFAVISLAALAACDPPVPNSGAGVGFGSYSDYQASREAELIASGEGGTAARPMAISSEMGATSGDDIAEDAMAAIGRASGAPADPTGQLEQGADVALAGTVENGIGISAENDFSAVTSERSIAEDAARVAANRQAYEVVEPTSVPARPSGSGTSLVEFALSTTNSVGQPIYSRLTVGAQARAERSCAKYPSPDLAQDAFLAGGGPQRNVKGMDPDGDGFACSWDPRPFRLASRSN